MARRWSVALLAVFLSGCVGLVGSTPTPVVVHPHATGQHDLLLRMSIGGGLPWPGKTVDDPPRFSLYGDGLAIYQVNTRSADGTPRSELRAARLDQNQIDALIADALGAGGLLAAEPSYRDVDVYDAVTTRFEFHAGGVDKTVGVYALGLQDFLAPSRDERAAFSSLAHRLGDFGADVTAGKATDLGTYQPQAYRVTLKEPYATDTTVRAWPWPDLSAADFDPDADGNLVRIVTADQAQAILGLGVTSDLVVRGPDGHTYLIGIAVALPDQQA